MTTIDTTRPPPNAASVKPPKPSLLQSLEHHHLCSGCGHPVAVRLLLEVMDELQLQGRSVGVFGHGCSGTFNSTADVDVTIALHGRAPACATGIKRMRPDTVVFTMQGDGDMMSEGLAEIIHAAARGEKITCILLNNGVFGDTGGQMTAGSVIGQRTKTSIEGRNAETHGYPVPLPDMLKTFPGVSYVARGSVYNAAGIVQAKKLIRRGFEHQLAGAGLALVEILTMCPTGWFMAAKDGPEYLMDTLGKDHGTFGALKDSLAPGQKQAAG